jgi:hypothetical protein
MFPQNPIPDHPQAGRTLTPPHKNNLPEKTQLLGWIL